MRLSPLVFFTVYGKLTGHRRNKLDIKIWFRGYEKKKKGNIPPLYCCCPRYWDCFSLLFFPLLSFCSSRSIQPLALYKHSDLALFPYIYRLRSMTSSLMIIAVSDHLYAPFPKFQTHYQTFTKVSSPAWVWFMYPVRRDPNPLSKGVKVIIFRKVYFT